MGEELREQQAQEEKYARLEKIEAEKQKAWEEKKLDEEERKREMDEKRKRAAQESQNKPNVSEAFEAVEMNLDEQETIEPEAPKKTAKKGSRSASADKRKKAADIAKDTAT